MNLDQLRKAALDYLDSLWEYQYEGGGFKINKDGYCCLMATGDAAWIYYAVSANDKIAQYGRDAAIWLNAKQLPNGSFFHDFPRKNNSGYRHSDGHAFWHTIRSMNIYGEKLKRYPDYFRNMEKLENMTAWFDGIDWKSKESNHHNVLALIPVLYAADKQWQDTFFEKIAAQQNQNNGAWCDNKEQKVNISRSFAYTALFTAAGRRVPNAEKLIKSVIASQNEFGYWENYGMPDFHTMDSMYILWRLGNAVGFPFSERKNCMEKAMTAIERHIAEVGVENMETHHLMALIYALGLLKEAFPEQLQSRYQWRFDWDRAEMFI